MKAVFIVYNQTVPAVLEGIKKLDEENKEVGIRAFVWNVEDSY